MNFYLGIPFEIFFFFWCNFKNCYQAFLLFRILKRLRVKNPKEIELEQLEQGFSIYLNGANAECSKKHLKSSDNKSNISLPAWRSARTAGMKLDYST